MITTNVGDHISKRAELGPDLEAVVDIATSRRFTYAQLNERVDRVAEALTGLGLAFGDRVAVLLPNGHRYVELYYAAARAGLILVPVNQRLVADEVAYILRDSGAKAMIVDEGHRELGGELRDRSLPVEHWLTVGDVDLEGAADFDALVDAASGAPFAPVGGDDDPLFIMYTSGTTGRPKGAVHTHTTIEWSFLTVAPATDMRFRDRYLIGTPLYHIGAFNNVGTTLYCGGVAVLLHDFDPEQFWDVLRDEEINLTLAVPAMLNVMLQAHDPERHTPLALRWIESGAAPVPGELVDAYAEMGLTICQGYGLTESGGAGCIITPADAPERIGSTGKPFFHTSVRIVDSEGAECPPDVAGELTIRGRHVMKEYWNMPLETQAALPGGWLYTGDIAVRDGDGFIYVLDRLKDMIISGGENVYPAEVERVLITHPLVADVAVIGVPSERWGESPMAVVVPVGGAELEAADVIEHCSGKLARFKIPKSVVFTGSLPRTSTGKVEKEALRDEFVTSTLSEQP